MWRDASGSPDQPSQAQTSPIPPSQHLKMHTTKLASKVRHCKMQRRTFNCDRELISVHEVYDGFQDIVLYRHSKWGHIIWRLSPSHEQHATKVLYTQKLRERKWTSKLASHEGKFTWSSHQHASVAVEGLSFRGDQRQVRVGLLLLSLEFQQRPINGTRLVKVWHYLLKTEKKAFWIKTFLFVLPFGLHFF